MPRPFEPRRVLHMLIVCVCPRASVRSSADAHHRGVPAAATSRGKAVARLTRRLIVAFKPPIGCRLSNHQPCRYRRCFKRLTSSTSISPPWGCRCSALACGATGTISPSRFSLHACIQSSCSLAASVARSLRLIHALVGSRCQLLLCACTQAPVVIAAAILLGFLASPFVEGILALDYRWFRRGRPKERLLSALPWLLLLVFVVSPMVSSAAFRAFSCEEFDDG